MTENELIYCENCDSYLEDHEVIGSLSPYQKPTCDKCGCELNGFWPDLSDEE
jgi:methionyl-tRNA synthetase